ncbi:hypothetical protein E0485_11440 [Paenibacillus albiflavus]|uniref:Uncharacterized protein n=1 Tax=Paenibacillus albiflavus TaxID=2545760 RepID=A0A4R4ED05_9BACL|nr:hypothetical protein [Paenibacillus albiflavus]TCZ77073.1 hypothetical protein E0485_11440 [Paenibacillus albiflavus]
MKRLILYEFKKLWNKPAILAVVALMLYSAMMTGIYYLYYEQTTITGEGEKVSGVGAYWAVKEEAKELEGTVDQQYLENLVKQFNSSIEKKDFEHRFGMDMMKYQYSNQLINFAAFGGGVSNFTMGLDFDFLGSEKDFYNQFKSSVKQLIRDNNEFNWFRYTDEQLKKIDEKVDAEKMPFEVSYASGLEKITIDYAKQYWLVLIVLAFALSGIFSKDSSNGIDEISLSSTYGRKKNMNAKIMAGNLFAITVYVIFLAALFALNGSFASLHGLGQSAQAFWYTCLYDINMGMGMLLMFGLGLLGILIAANFIMMISIRVKYAKLSAVLSVASVWALVELTKTANPLQLQLNPIYFATRLGVINSGITDFDPYFFIGDVMIPYSLIAVGLTIIYIAAIRLLTVSKYKRYALRG